MLYKVCSLTWAVISTYCYCHEPTLKPANLVISDLFRNVFK